MRQPQNLFGFMLFLEEFILWEPGSITTISELLMRAVALSVDVNLLQYVNLLNPAWCALLFLASIGSVAKFFKSFIPYGLKILLNRLGWIIALIIFAVVIYKTWQILSVPTETNNIMQIYQNKPLLSILFAGITAHQLLVGEDK